MNKISIFRKNKLVESTLLQGALVAFIFYIGGFGELNFFYILLPCILVSALIQLVFYIIYGKHHLAEVKSQQQVFFDGDIESLTKELCCSGLKLRSLIGKFYIYSPSYYLFPKDDVLVFESHGGCFLQSKHIVVKYLSELITFRTLPSKSKIDNKNTCNNRKRDRDSSNSIVVPSISNNEKRR
ncbi:MAG: hypothetical protein NWP91_03005 [Rickettsiaceae bacterium]|jgi:hypothetical protein|nr:hypothetical protein [Rickettsiaceae bacterium]